MSPTSCGGRQRLAGVLVSIAVVLASCSSSSSESGEPTTSGANGSTSTTSEPAAISGVDCVPEIEGPIATASSPPFRAALQSDLPSGWVDDEFFISCSSAAITYETAVFVRRPDDAGEASGVVAVEPLHSLGIWGLQTLLQPYFVAEGDVHIGIAASTDTVERLLKPANPDRYAPLDVPATPDAENQILAGMGALLHQHPDALLPGVEFRAAILGGWSQTGAGHHLRGRAGAQRLPPSRKRSRPRERGEKLRCPPMTAGATLPFS